MKAPQIIIGVVAALVLAGGGFAAGMTVERNNTAEATKSAAPSGAAGRAGQGGTGAFVGRGGASGAAGAAGQQILAGRVLSVNDGSITLEVRQPGAQGASPTVTSQIVLVGSSTRVVKTTEQEIKLSDLKANDQVQIIAATDANGQISANAIIAGGNALQQLFGGPGGTGGRGASPSPSPTR
ncbi:MAG: hypothetical protein E6I57_04045 [Chloroflexi bacterium]|nr:MAG: hypothetical protein E6J49_13720 [Chloroflexota bacterium]TMB76147.1 MAG: hypothetical protein E6J52_08210 [Chloroflexota bacterium]TMB96537.1 MAG: hypothetical protein E6J38_03695 [Chloroflexota bacterium]TMC29274.1 MAG: hypothetical protein E6J27_05945 [Chloroflexota bacterium]TMC31917.1 MAG: hypothetical protein E6J24_14990 [Chloroflexota bacterium]